MPKRILPALIKNWGAPLLEGRFGAGSAQAVESLLTYTPPQSRKDWEDGTRANGLLFGTKSRGARLQKVDEKYELWISGDLYNYDNALELYEALFLYMGFARRIELDASRVSGDYTKERDAQGHLTKMLYLTRILTEYSPQAKARRDERMAADPMVVRRKVVTLMGNIRINWNWTTDLIGGLGFVANVPETIPGGQDKVKELVAFVKDSKTAQGVLGGVGPVAVVAIGALVVAPPPPPNQDNSAFVAAFERLKRGLIRLFNEFKEWASGKLASLLACRLTDIVSYLSAILNIVFSYVLKEAVPFVGPAADAVNSIHTLVKTAWSQSKLAAAEAVMVVREGVFAEVANSVKRGLVRREAVAAWTLAMSGIKTGLAVVGLHALAAVIIGGFELAVKMVFNALENSNIKKFTEQASDMAKRVLGLESGSPVVVQGDVDEPTPVLKRRNAVYDLTTLMEPELEVPSDNYSAGFAPPFKAIDYSVDDFLADKGGAFIHFVKAATQASPIIGAILMKSGIFSDYTTAFHSATAHSRNQEKAADDYIAILTVEAKEIYRASSFKVDSSRTTNFSDGLTYSDNTWFQESFANVRAA